MNQRGQWLLVAVIVAAGAIGVALGVRAKTNGFDVIAEGSRAPGFRGMTLDSVPVARTLADYAGQVTIVNVWATWCAPCRTEMPSFERLYNEYRDDGLRIVAVSVDAPGMEEPIRDFVAELGLTFDIIHDSRGAIQRDYMTMGVPETFVIDKRGIIRLKELGYEQWDLPARKTFFEQLLAEEID